MTRHPLADIDACLPLAAWSDLETYPPAAWWFHIQSACFIVNLST